MNFMELANVPLHLRRIEIILASMNKPPMLFDGTARRLTTAGAVQYCDGHCGGLVVLRLVVKPKRLS
jgi:hypothetical protein